MPSEFVRQLNDDLEQVLSRALQSLVTVRSGRRGAGACVVVHPDGLVVTAAHVLGRGSPEVVLPGGQTVPARLVGYDESADLAALSVAARGLTAMDLGDSSRLRPGEWVMALGHPLGVRGAATGGVVIGVGEGWQPRPGANREWVSAALHLRPGHSGGPMIDAQGRLVGINTIMAGLDIGLAVPVHVVKAFLKQAMRSEAAPVVV